MEIIAVVATLAFLLIAGIPKASVDLKREAADRRNPNDTNAVAWHATSGCFFWIIVFGAIALFMFVAGGSELVVLLGETALR